MSHQYQPTVYYDWPSRNHGITLEGGVFKYTPYEYYAGDQLHHQNTVFRDCEYVAYDNTHVRFLNSTDIHLYDTSGIKVFDSGTLIMHTSASPDSRGFIVDQIGRVGIGMDHTEPHSNGVELPSFDLDIKGQVGVEDYIYHNDDVDTYMLFGSDLSAHNVNEDGGSNTIYPDDQDEINFFTGDVAMLQMRTRDYVFPASNQYVSDLYSSTIDTPEDQWGISSGTISTADIGPVSFEHTAEIVDTTPAGHRAYRATITIPEEFNTCLENPDGCEFTVNYNIVLPGHDDDGLPLSRTFTRAGSVDAQDHVTFNKYQSDVDFVIRSVDEPNMLFVDGENNRISIGDSENTPQATLEVTNDPDSGAFDVPLVQLNNKDTDKQALDINADNIDANVIDVTASSLTTGRALDISTCDSLTTGKIANFRSDSSSSAGRDLVTILNNNESATGARLLYVRNDAIARQIETIRFESTAADLNPLLELRNSGTEIDTPPRLNFKNLNYSVESQNVDIGTITFEGQATSESARVLYAALSARATDIETDKYGGVLNFMVQASDSPSQLRNMLSIGGQTSNNDGVETQAEVVVNEDQIDLDFRVESHASDRMFQVDAAENLVTVYGPSGDDTDVFTVNGNGDDGQAGHELLSITPVDTVFNDDSNDIDFRVESATNHHAFFIRGDGSEVSINDDGRADTNFRVESAASEYVTEGHDPHEKTHALFVQTSTGRVGIGKSSPQTTLHVAGSAHIEGDLWVKGVTNQIDTLVHVTSAMDITNIGTGPALEVTQTGAQPIASFYDDDVPAMYIEDGGEIGMGTSTPGGRIHVWDTSASNKESLGLILSNYHYQNSGTNLGQSVAIEGRVKSAGGGDISTAKLVFGKDSNYSDANHSDGNLRFEIMNGTGGTAQLVERMRIVSSGNVGIGTTHPIARLNVQDGHILVNRSANTTQENILLQGAGYRLSNGTLYGNVSIRSNYHNGTNAGSLNFYTAPSSTATTERMRIQPDGKVGIGTTGPSAKLEVHTQSDNKDGAYGNLADSLLLKNTSDMVGAGPKLIFYNANNPGSPTSAPSALIGLQRVDNASNRGNMVFYTRGASDPEQRMIIDSIGNVGIGTTHPDNKLEVKTPGGKYGLSIVDDTESEQHLGGLYVTNNGATTDGLDLFLKQPGGNTKVAIRSNNDSYFMGGNIGIGTKTPGTAYKLHIAGGTPAMKLEGTQPRIWLSENDQTNLNTLIRNNNAKFQIDTVKDDDSLINNRLTIKHGNGFVGLDTDSPTGPLTIGAASRVNEAGSFPYMTFDSTHTASVDNTNLGAIFFKGKQPDGTLEAGAAIRARGHGTAANTANNVPGQLVFQTNPGGTGGLVDRMIIGKNGDITAAGSLITANRMRLQKDDNDVSDHLQFYNGTTRVGEIGCEDSTWLRINQETAKNIYTPRMIRADGGFNVDNITVVDGNANIIGERVTGTVPNADKVDNLHASSFARSDADDTVTGLLNMSRAAECLRLTGSGSTASPHLSFYQYNPQSMSGTRRAYIQFNNGTKSLHLYNDYYDDYLKLGDGAAGLRWNYGGGDYKVWHQGNDGAGSTLDADLLDGLHASSFHQIGSNIDVGAAISANNVEGGEISIRTTSGISPYYVDTYRDANNAHNHGAGKWLWRVFFGNGSGGILTFDGSTGDLRTQGDIVAYNSSDSKYKDNLTPIPDALDKTLSLTGYEFDWNDKQTTYTGHDVGVVAQEVEKVLPEIVETRANESKAVRYEKMIPLLIESIKAQQAQIAELTRKVEQLSK